jgi:hypothetical protein
VFLNQRKALAIHESETIFEKIDFADTTRERFWIDA